LGETVSIINVFESEGSRTNVLLVEDGKKRKVIIEIQNSSEFDFFHQMLYGVSKVFAKYIKKGEKYIETDKVYSINIMYFTLERDKGYCYHGGTEFQNMFDKDDFLQLSNYQLNKFKEKQITYQNIYDICPEYFVLKVNKFNDVATTPLAEWMYFLKTREIPENFTAQGLDEAREKLKVDDLTPQERIDYYAHIKRSQYEETALETAEIKGKIEGIEIGIAEGKAEAVPKLYTSGIPIEQIRQITDFSRDKIIEILKTAELWQEPDK
jgi:predicted transposase/invertase (TIGR01784 family)